MKKVIMFLIVNVVRMIHFFIRPSMINAISRRWKILYSVWISFEFKHCGENFRTDGLYKLIGAKYMTIGDDVSIGKNVVLEAISKYRQQRFEPEIQIGDNSCLNDDCHITCINKIKIGNHVRTGRKCIITDNAHGASDRSLLDMAPNYRPLNSKGPIIIEDNVWIGEMCCIMPGVKIGHGSIIGANTVVTKDIPPYSVVVGPSGKVIKNLAENEILS